MNLNYPFLSFSYFISDILKCDISASYFILPVLFRILFVLQFFLVMALNFDITHTHTRAYIWSILNSERLYVYIYIVPHCPLILTCISHLNKDVLLCNCSIVVRFRNWILMQYFFIYCHILVMDFLALFFFFSFIKGSSPVSSIAFSCHVSLNYFNLKPFLSFL